MSWAKRLARVFLGGAVSGGSWGKGASAPRGRRVAVEALEDRRLLSVGFDVTDVDTGGVTPYGDPIVFGNAVYFSGHEATHGAELWKMDANEDVSLVADINPDSESSHPREFAVLGNTLFFSAGEPDHGVELWAMNQDGSVTLVEDIAPGSAPSTPSELTRFDSEIYFHARHNDGNVAVWKVDESGNVRMVQEMGDSTPWRYNWIKAQFTVVNEHLYYRDPQSRFWKLDSSDTSYELGQLEYDSRITALDDSLFILEPGHHGNDSYVRPSVWQLDSFGERTFLGYFGRVPVDPVPFDYSQSFYQQLPITLDSTVYIPVVEALGLSYGDDSAALWSIDATGQTEQVTDLGVFSFGAEPINMSLLGDWLFFNDGNYELHVVAPPGMAEVASGVPRTIFDSSVAFGDFLYFRSGNGFKKLGIPEFDYGDAPESYGASLTANGARHVATGPTLGAKRDAEADGLPTVSADGDDIATSDDEDGVTFASTTFVTSADVNVQNAPDGAKLDGWVDFNGDGSFGGPGEQIFDSLDVIEGANPLSFVVPEGAIAGDTYARFRLSSAGGLAPIGSAADGEVEDYLVSIIPADTPYSLLSETVDVGHGAFPEGVSSVVIDGNYGISGATVYHRDGNEWREMQQLSPESTLDTDGYGKASAISGTRVAVAADTSVFVYELVEGEWRTQGAWALPTDSVAGEIVLDGDTLAVQASDISVLVYQWVDVEWGLASEWTLPEDSGTISDVDLEGPTIAVLAHTPDQQYYDSKDLASLFLIEQVDGNWEVVQALGHKWVDSIQLKNGTLGVRKNGFYIYEDWDTARGSLSAGVVSVYRRTENGWVGKGYSAEVTREWWGTFANEDIWDEWDDGLGMALAVDGDRAFGVADEYILELQWNDSLGHWEEVGRISVDFASPIALDGDVVAYEDAQSVIIDSPSGERHISLGSTLDFLEIEDGTVFASVPDVDQVQWYDVNFESETEEFQVAVKEGGEITVSTSGETIPRIDVYDPSGQLVASDWSFLTCVASSMGVYTVKTTAQTDQWVSYDVSILSEVPASTGPLVADYLEMVYALPPDQANLLPLEAARDGYLTVVGREVNSTDEFGFVLLDEDKNVLETASPTTDQGAGAWSYERRLDYLVTGGESFYLMVLGDGSQVDLRVCNLVSQTGDTVDVFDTYRDDRYLFSVSDTFDVTANSVDYRFDDATSFTFHSEAGDDTIEMVDSDGDDTLTVSPSQMVLSGTTSGGTAFSATADGFRYAHGYAKAGGNDAAQFVGSAQADRVKAYEQLVKAMGGAHYARAKFFERVEVDLGDGVDAAVIVPSSGSDVLRAMKDEVCVAHDVDLAAGARPAFASMAYDVTIVGAERVVARGRGGDDWVELHDSALNDVFIAKPHKVEMMNGPREGVERGAEYRISARGYRNVSAIADQGGDTDVAKLYDTGEEGVDVWAAAYADGQTWSTMASPSRLLYEVLAFEQVGGYGFNGGLGEGHGTNRPEHGDDVDFVFKYGYWEGDEEPGPTDPRTERGR